MEREKGRITDPQVVIANIRKEFKNLDKNIIL